MKGLPQKSCIDAWKRSYMGCSSLLCGRFADSQESRLQASKRSNMGVLFWKEVVLLIFRNSVFMLQNVQICNVSKCNGVYLLIIINGILAAKSSNKICTILQEGRFALAQE